MTGTVLSACSQLSIDEVSEPQPRFEFLEYFDGPTRASGWFSSRSGEPRRHFCGDFIGERRGNSLRLDETLNYTDGVVETRLWNVTIDDDGGFRASGESLVGDAIGTLSGNALQMRYRMNVVVEQDGDPIALDFNDFMLLQPDGSLHNHTQVYKFGIRLGTVTTQYERHDGSRSCKALSEQTA